MNLREQQKIETRNKLIDAAAHCLQERGFSGATTPIIVEMLGVTRGALNHHFPSKNALLLAVCERLFDDMAATFGARVTASDDLAQRVSKLTDDAWGVISSPIGIAHLEIWLASRRDEELHKRMATLVAKSDKLRLTVWLRLLADAPVPPHRLEIAKDHLFGSLLSLAMQTAVFDPPEYYTSQIKLLKELTLYTISERGSGR